MPFCSRSLPVLSLCKTLAPDIRRSLELHQRGSFNVSRSQFELGLGLRRRIYGGNVCLAGIGSISGQDRTVNERINKRLYPNALLALRSLKNEPGLFESIVEHISLLSAKTDLSEDEEKDMLDHLYTSQYQMSGVIAISLGRIVDPNVDNFTHAVYMRFQKKEDLTKFYTNSYYSGILKGHVIPYCYGLISVDYESEVEDDILSIFRRGEEFNYGVECIILLSVFETAPQLAVDDALATLQKLIVESCSLIVQATQGSNFNLTESEYTHAAVIRFPSFEAFQMFRESSQYEDMWRLKFHPISKKALVIRVAVDPVGSELM